jgi:hypothetical protein
MVPVWEEELRVKLRRPALHNEWAGGDTEVCAGPAVRTPGSLVTLVHLTLRLDDAGTLVRFTLVIVVRHYRFACNAV